jgi:hypothetical protein
MSASTRPVRSFFLLVMLACGCVVGPQKEVRAADEVAPSATTLVSSMLRSDSLAPADRAFRSAVILPKSGERDYSLTEPSDARWELAARPMLANQPRFQRAFLVTLESRF